MIAFAFFLKNPSVISFEKTSEFGETISFKYDNPKSNYM